MGCNERDALVGWNTANEGLDLHCWVMWVSSVDLERRPVIPVSTDLGKHKRYAPFLVPFWDVLQHPLLRHLLVDDLCSIDTIPSDRDRHRLLAL